MMYCFFFIQFGHAGALANSQLETADAKNTALRAAGAVVPHSFQDFHLCIAHAYQTLHSQGKIQLVCTYVSTSAGHFCNPGIGPQRLTNPRIGIANVPKSIPRHVIPGCQRFRKYRKCTIFFIKTEI